MISETNNTTTKQSYQTNINDIINLAGITIRDLEKKISLFLSLYFTKSLLVTTLQGPLIEADDRPSQSFSYLDV